MRNRQFRFPDTQTAMLYITYLVRNGIPFSVKPLTNGVDVITPFELAVSDFPNPEWLS